MDISCFNFHAAARADKHGFKVRAGLNRSRPAMSEKEPADREAEEKARTSGADGALLARSDKDGAKKSQGRFCSQITVIKAAWEQVAQALWRRYPNPYSKHVLSEDLVSRKCEGSKLFSKRLMRKTNKGPKWLEKFVGGPGAMACIIEESEVDSAARTFTTYTRNITFSKLMSVEEKCVYYTSPDNKEWTCCKRQAWIKCGVMGISRAVEKFGAERFKRNAIKAELGLDHVIKLFFGSRIAAATGNHTSATSTKCKH